MKPKPIPERGELVALLENCTTRQVCVHYGVAAPTLYNWIAKLSIERKKKQPNYGSAAKNDIATPPNPAQEPHHDAK